MNDDQQWVVNICDLLAKNVPGVRICQVPKYWSSTKKEAYIPQFVGLGLYHHFRPEAELPLQDEMKLVAAQTFLKGFLEGTPARKLLLQQHLKSLTLDPDIQGFYKVDENTFNNNDHLHALIVDGLFLLGLLHSDFKAEEYIYSLFVTHGIDPASVKLTMGGIISDVFMLENQIPLVFLKRIKEVIFSGETQPHSQGEANKVLGGLKKFCEESCPLVKFEKLGKIPENYDHLLDLMYYLIVPESKPEEERLSNNDKNVVRIKNLIAHQTDLQKKPLHQRLGFHLLKAMGMYEYKIQIVPDQQPKPPARNRQNPNQRNCCSKIIRFVFWCIFGSLLFLFLLVVYIVILIIQSFLWLLSYLLFGRLGREFLSLIGPLGGLLIVMNSVLKVFHDLEAPFIGGKVKPYAEVVRQIEQVNENLLRDRTVWDMPGIPATELHHSGGIKFCPAQGGISFIEFDEENCKFYLPRIKLNVNSEVIIRNLLAYEQLTKSDDLNFSGYIQLMGTLIETPEDVKLLVREKIIDTKLSGEVVVQLLHGMNKSIRPAGTMEASYELMKAIFKFDENRRLKRVVTKYSICSGKIFIVLAALTFLVLATEKLFCSVFGCSSAPKLGQLPADKNNLFLSTV